jgi:hypothetical protein
LLTIVEYDTL